MREDKEKKCTWDGTGIEKRILSMHHPSTVVHWWVLVHSVQYVTLQKDFLHPSFSYYLFSNPTHKTKSRTASSSVNNPIFWTNQTI
jgi:hypothetical protein